MPNRCFYTLKCSPVKDSTEIDIYIIPLATEKQALRLATVLRREGKQVEVELRGKKLRKAMDKANREHVAKVIVLGESEVERGYYTLKDMASGEVETVSFPF